MKTIAAWIAKVGTNPEFIAFNAHCWFAYAIVYTSHHMMVANAVIALAAVKEFYFDATFEVPKQGWQDNLTDWAGYTFGALLAVSVMWLSVARA